MKPIRNALFRHISGLITALLALCLLVATGADAQFTVDRDASALSGVLKRIKDHRLVRIGYRESAVPLSYRTSGGQPIGYSIDLCQAVVEDIADAVGLGQLRVEYRLVTPADRIEQVMDGRIDLECGATTRTEARRQQVAFSPIIFIAGTRLLVRRGSGIRSLRDTAGQRIVVVRGTTNEEAMRRLVETGARNIQLVVADDYAAAFARLASGEVAAMAADDILLAAHVAEQGLKRDYALVGELLSYEPYGIMFARGDTALDAVVQGALRRLASSREIRTIYNRWFLRPLPSGITLGVPMSPQLERALQLLGLPVD